MSYNQAAISNYDAQPSKLYDFSIGSTHWSYSSSEEPFTIGAITFLPMAISDSGPTQSGDVTGDDLVVTLPADAPVCQLFAGTPPTAEIILVLRERMEGQSETKIVFVGLVRSTKRVSQIEMQIVCKPRTVSLNRNGLRLAWGRSCPYVLYDSRCRVNPNTFGTNAVVSSMSTTRITSSTFNGLTAAFLANGYVEWDSGHGYKERRSIDRKDGNNIYIIGQTDNLSIGRTVRVFPGCNLTARVCDERFGNLSNFGGFERMPGRSPFDGKPVY